MMTDSGKMPFGQVIYRRMKFAVKNRLDAYPALYGWIYQTLSRNKNLFVHHGTDLVLDGFPSSGNTFLLRYIKNLVDAKLLISHHMHSSAQIIIAGQAKVPTILCVRDPVDCSISNAVRQVISYGRVIIPPQSWIGYWTRYHENIIQQRDNEEFLRVARFDEIIGNTGDLISKISRDLDIKINHRNPVRQDLFSQINADEAELKVGRYRNAALPSEEKTVMKRAMHKSFRREFKSEIERAYHVYSELQGILK